MGQFSLVVVVCLFKFTSSVLLLLVTVFQKETFSINTLKLLDFHLLTKYYILVSLKSQIFFSPQNFSVANIYPKLNDKVGLLAIDHWFPVRITTNNMSSELVLTQKLIEE